MVPRKRRGRLTKSAAATSSITQAVQVNTHGLPALADEIYLEIVSYIPSVPIPTPISCHSHPMTRRSRHETLLSLSQTCRSLRRFFWRYLWQRIEVREGMQVGEDEFLESIRNFSRGNKKPQKNYAFELVGQLEVVTVRNPDLAQHVNYLDIMIGEYSFDRVIVELARCMSLFPNMHTIQIDVTMESKRDLKKIFAKTFKKYSYPQIRNVFIMSLTVDLLSSCPEVKHIGFTQQWRMSADDLLNIACSCPHLEALDDFGNNIQSRYWQLIPDNFPALRHISMSPSAPISDYSMNVLAKMSHLQSITLILKLIYPDMNEKRRLLETLKRILITIQSRDNLVKFLIVKDCNGRSQTITLRPAGTNVLT